jgi:hypothetical protein
MNERVVTDNITCMWGDGYLDAIASDLVDNFSAVSNVQDGLRCGEKVEKGSIR